METQIKQSIYIKQISRQNWSKKEKIIIYANKEVAHLEGIMITPNI